MNDWTYFHIGSETFELQGLNPCKSESWPGGLEDLTGQVQCMQFEQLFSLHKLKTHSINQNAIEKSLFSGALSLSETLLYRLIKYQMFESLYFCKGI